MMDAATVASAVARTVRALRATRGWSLDVLAARSGVSKGVLVALEHGHANPSLGTLIRVSEAFGIPLTRLVQQEDPQVRILPADRHVTLWHGPAGGTGVLVAGTDPRPSVELWRWELHPGESRDSDPHRPGTREIAAVEEGTLTLVVDGRPHAVEAGGAVVFAADLPHGYANEGPTVLRFTLVVRDA